MPSVLEAGSVFFEASTYVDEYEYGGRLAQGRLWPRDLDGWARKTSSVRIQRDRVEAPCAPKDQVAGRKVARGLESVAL